MAVNDVIWPNHKKSFPIGTILTDLVPTVDGYILTPESVDQVILDQNRTLNFTAVAIPVQDYVPLITDWEIGDTVVVITGNNIDYLGSQRCRNNKVLISSAEGGIRCIPFGAGIGFGPNNTSMAGRNEMFFGLTKSTNDNKIDFFSMGTNLFQSAAVPGDAICEITSDGTTWYGIVNGVVIGSTPKIAGDIRIHSYGSEDDYVHNVEEYGFN